MNATTKNQCRVNVEFSGFKLASLRNNSASSTRSSTTLALPSVLQIGKFPPAQQAIIDREVQPCTEDDLQRDPAMHTRIEAILTRSNHQIPSSLLTQLPRSKVISTSSMGFDGIPVDAAQRSGIVVTNTPGVLDAAICELAVGLTFTLLRRIPDTDRFVRMQKWADKLFH